MQHTIELPYPPSVNHYWGEKVLHVRGRWMPIKYLSKRGKEFQAAVVAAYNGPTFTGRLEVTIDHCAPTRRQCDIDNNIKPLFDALTIAGAWLDDSQIDRFTVTRREVHKGGRVIVTITEAKGE